MTAKAINIQKVVSVNSITCQVLLVAVFLEKQKTRLKPRGIPQFDCSGRQNLGSLTGLLTVTYCCNFSNLCLNQTIKQETVEFYYNFIITLYNDYDYYCICHFLFRCPSPSRDTYEDPQETQDNSQGHIFPSLDFWNSCNCSSLRVNPVLFERKV